MLNTVTLLRDDEKLTSECVEMENSNENRLRLEFELKAVSNPSVILKMENEEIQTFLEANSKSMIEVPEMWLLNGKEFHVIYNDDELNTDILFTIGGERNGDMITKKESSNYCVVFYGKTNSNNVECYGKIKLHVNGVVLEWLGGIVS